MDREAVRVHGDGFDQLVEQRTPFGLGGVGPRLREPHLVQHLEDLFEPGGKFGRFDGVGGDGFGVVVEVLDGLS